jgi:hypothetical protein
MHENYAQENFDIHPLPEDSNPRSWWQSDLRPTVQPRWSVCSLHLSSINSGKCVGPMALNGDRETLLPYVQYSARAKSKNPCIPRKIFNRKWNCVNNLYFLIIDKQPLRHFDLLWPQIHPLIIGYILKGVAARSEARTVFDRSNTGITGSNPARGMDVCTHFSVLCCAVYVEALRWADPPSKEFYRMSK